MESKIIFEVTCEKNGYSVWAHNEGMSINRTYSLGVSAHMGTLLQTVATELLGEPADQEDEAVRLIEANEDAMQAACEAQGGYEGVLDDDYEDAYERWLSNLKLDDVKKILATQPDSTLPPSVKGE